MSFIPSLNRRCSPAEGMIRCSKQHGKLEICGQTIYYTATVADRSMRTGINNGRIIKLKVLDNNIVYLSYNYGWELKPTDKIGKDALNLLINLFES